MDGLSNLNLDNKSSVLTLEGEEIHLVQRPHALTIIPSIILLSFLVVFLIGGIVIASMFFSPPMISFVAILSVLILGLFLFGQTILNWYFHFYVLTNRKILELSYSPFGDCIINNVLLDQVKCTEVDMHSPGFFYQLLDIGNISITFDRPTHQQEFLIEKIKDYRRIGTHLGGLLVNQEKPQEGVKEAMWIRDQADPSHYNYTEIIPSVRR